MAMTPTANSPAERAAAIRAQVRQLAPGEVVTYGQIAIRAGLPGRARLVGTVLRETPDDAPLPWHRVIASGGRIAFAPDSPAAIEQRERLRAEGVWVEGWRVRRTAVPDLDALVWAPPGAAKMARGRKGKGR